MDLFFFSFFFNDETDIFSLELLRRIHCFMDLFQKRGRQSFGFFVEVTSVSNIIIIINAFSHQSGLATFPGYGV